MYVSSFVLIIVYIVYYYFAADLDGAPADDDAQSCQTVPSVTEEFSDFITSNERPPEASEGATINNPRNTQQAQASSNPAVNNNSLPAIGAFNPVETRPYMSAPVKIPYGENVEFQPPYISDDKNVNNNLPSGASTTTDNQNAHRRHSSDYYEFSGRSTAPGVGGGLPEIGNVNNHQYHSASTEASTLPSGGSHKIADMAESTAPNDNNGVGSSVGLMNSFPFGADRSKKETVEC